jgi:hypothetical protein
MFFGSRCFLLLASMSQSLAGVVAAHEGQDTLGGVWRLKSFLSSHRPSLTRAKPWEKEAIASGVLCPTLSFTLQLSGGGKVDKIYGDKSLCQVLTAPAFLFHITFAVVAVLGLALQVGSLGNRIFALVIGYNVALFVVASKNGYQHWLNIWQLLVPLSALMVIPDWFQADYQDILVYPDTGGPRIGPVSAAMAGMWTIALFPLVLLGRHVEQSKGRKEAGFATVAVAGLALFALAEANSWRIPIWTTRNCRHWGRMAYFPIPAEVTLAMMTYAASSAADTFLMKCVAAVLLMLLFVGTAAIAYLFIDIIPDAVTCAAFKK